MLKRRSKQRPKQGRKRRRLPRSVRISLRLGRFALRHRRWTVRLVRNAALGLTFGRGVWRLRNLARRLRQ